MLTQNNTPGKLDVFRPQLLAIAYHMTGDYQEAKDIVQDSFETWISRPRQVENAEAYLRKMTVNRSIDRLKALKTQREAYKGVWLPVPLIAEMNPEPSNAQPADMLSLGVLHLLEKLNPLERAVLILKESFACPYEEIAMLCETSAQNCRQLLHRAKEKLQLPTVRYTVDEQQYRQLLEAFLVACREENPDKLARLLKEDIELYTDGGGKMPAALKPLKGTAHVVKFLLKVMPAPGDITLRWILVNGIPGIVFFNSHTGKADTVMTLAVEDGQITALYVVRNPDKLIL
jgi:RNA polymerase sigma-70 factor (ECF subfamily)